LIKITPEGGRPAIGKDGGVIQSYDRRYPATVFHVEAALNSYNIQVQEIII